jgi:ubiquinone/menaquinone biosynthesis C-methylase UbiE
VIDNIVVFFTKDDLSNLLSEKWGKELQKEFDYFQPGFVFTTNEDEPEDLRRAFEEATAEGLASQWVITGTFPEDPGISEEHRMAIEKSREEILGLCRAESARRILDWPTGNGYCLKHLVNRVDPEALVVALDINFRSLAKNKPYFDKNGFSDNMLFVVADARRMPFKDGVFQSVTAWGGTGEIENADAGFRETFRVLQSDGWFGVSGEQYKENSPSMKIAEQLGLDALLTKSRLQAAMKSMGFRNLEYEVLYEGYDIDDNLSDEERCPLPARRDWFGLIAASGQK